MDEWLVEKSGHAVEQLAELVDLIQKYEHVLPEEFLTQAQSSLSRSLHYATLVFASGSNSAYVREDSTLIFYNGSSGYKAISDRYRHGRTAYITDVQSLKESLIDILDEGMPNRSGIHELLRLCVIRSPVVEEMKNLSENMVMGEISWADFVREAKKRLNDLN